LPALPPQLIDSYYLASQLPDYCAAHPERIPPEDAGRPALPILSEFFCSLMWRQLVDTDADGKASAADIAALVGEADLNGDGGIDAAEFEAVVTRRLGDCFGGKVVAAQCISCADTNKDGVVSRDELATFLKRQGLAVSDGQRRSVARRKSSEGR
jgi:5'-nucleotidase